MRIRLSDHFTYGRLLRYTFPAIMAMIFTSVYNIVDGIFVSNFAGKQAFAAVNLVYPVFMIIGAIGFMLGSGGSAIVAASLGEKKTARAHQYFSMLIKVTFLLGLLATLLIELALPRLVLLLGARGDLIGPCLLYGRITTLTMPMFMLQTSFQTYFNVAEKPRLGLAITLLSGCANILLDALLVGVLGMGLAGAAIATNISEILGGLLPLLYFSRRNNSLLRLVKGPFFGYVLIRACTNGSSEMMSSVSGSLVSILYNYMLLRYGGTDAVAAYGAIMYSSFIFAAIFLGFSSGSSPIVSYQHGAQNHRELKSLFRKSLIMISAFALSMLLAAQLLGGSIARIFVGYDSGLLDLTIRGFRIFSFSFLLFGFNIYGSSFFTALGDGAVSAAISFLRTLVFEIAAILILPLLFGLDGIWSATICSELLALTVTCFFWISKRKKYGYA